MFASGLGVRMTIRDDSPNEDPRRKFLALSNENARAYRVVRRPQRSASA